MNEEFLVGAGHQLAPTTSLPFVHTARRYYRLNGLVRLLEDVAVAVSEIRRTWSFRGSKSRNKVSVGEPAEGSLKKIMKKNLTTCVIFLCGKGKEKDFTVLLSLFSCY